MPFNTRNPIPSGDLRDLDDNARNIDVWANDKTKVSHPDRFGVDRRTWHGIEQEAKLNIQQAIDAKNAAQEAAMMSGFSKYADTLAQLESGIGTDYMDGDVVLVFQDEERGNTSSIYKVESGVAVFKNAFDKTRQDLLSFTGNISADAEWSDVPAHSDPAFDVQAQALANRTEFIVAELTQPSGDDPIGGFSSYTEARLYTGSATRIQIKDSTGTHYWVEDPLVTTDNGGTLLLINGSRGFRREYSGSICAEWFGANPALPDNTSAIQNAIKSVGFQDSFDTESKGVTITFKTGGMYKVLGTLLLPSYVNIDLNGSTIEGVTGVTLFESAYFDADGSLKSNLTSTIDTRFVVCSSVCNGQIYNAGRAFYLLNFCEGSALKRLRMFGCNQALHARRCFYGKFEDIHSRSPQDALAYPCYNIDDSIGAVALNNVFAVSYDVGWLISGGKKDNLIAHNCGSESCSTGVRITGTTDSLQLRGWYFENNYNAIDFSTSSNHSNVVVDGCWFYGVTNAIQGATILSGEFTEHNVLNGATLNLPSNFAPNLKIGIATTSTPDTGTGTLPVNYALGDGCDVEYLQHVYDSISGNVSAKGRVYSGPVPHSYSGSSGVLIPNSIPFCECTITGTTLVIDTKINYQFAEFIGVNVIIETPSGSLLYSGIVSLESIMKLSGSAELVGSVQNNGGYYRIIIGGFTVATGFSGVVRIL